MLWQLSDYLLLLLFLRLFGWLPCCFCDARGIIVREFECARCLSAIVLRRQIRRWCTDSVSLLLNTFGASGAPRAQEGRLLLIREAEGDGDGNKGNEAAAASYSLFLAQFSLPSRSPLSRTHTHTSCPNG